MHRVKEPIFWQPKLLRDEIISEDDGLLFEIITEREITHHLKKCVMPCRIAHIFKVIMFATGSYAFLGRGRLGNYRTSIIFQGGSASKYIFKWHHTGISKEQALIAHRGDAGRILDVMPVPSEIGKEKIADISKCLVGYLGHLEILYHLIN